MYDFSMDHDEDGGSYSFYQSTDDKKVVGTNRISNGCGKLLLSSYMYNYEGRADCPITKRTDCCECEEHYL
ncbi:hypothetical protein ACOSP7_029518 [Xanthoceras sorbifolium]